MKVSEIEEKLKKLSETWSNSTFIFEMLLAYGLPKATITRVMKGHSNLSKEPGVVSIKNRVLFRAVEGEDLHVTISNMAKEAIHGQRFVIATDFKTLLAQDMSGKATPLETPFDELHKHYAYFLPWAGLEKTVVVNENPADRKAAEKLARLYDDLKEANDVQTEDERHALNVFLTRLLFCFFAEDTGIFEDNQFSVAIGSHTAGDGSDSSDYLRRLFRIMGTAEDKRESLPQHLAAFPFVGESLFGDDLPVPDITRKGRSTILAAGDLDWAAINPDIFGSMIQAVVSEENRGELGMHYTSVPNIMKVIGPLFLDELHEEFDKAQGSDTRLRRLLHRIHNLHIFDPACGSGNFLIITYKELRRLEMKILEEFNELPISGIRLDHFHGIEIDDFAHETAKLSMWLAEHQMNKEFEEVMGRSIPSLPLTQELKVIHANACRVQWDAELKADWELKVVGNPPYLGSSLMSEEQKSDVELVCGAIQGWKNLDYIAAWLVKASKLISSFRDVKVGMVSTNSICQGEQAGILWKNLFKSSRISFAYQSFKWTNAAKGNAGVTVIIVGLDSGSKGGATLFTDAGFKVVNKINQYLTAASAVWVDKRKVPLSPLVRPMIYGSKPVGGALILTDEERAVLVGSYPVAAKFIKGYSGAEDIIKGKKRFCLWIEDEEQEEALSIEPIEKRIEEIRLVRGKSQKAATTKAAEWPHRFGECRYFESNAIVVPRVSSERRDYLPIGFVGPEIVVADSSQQIVNATPIEFALISSRMHMVWLRTVGGRLKTDYRYSSVLVYNTFPFPVISKQKQEELALCALRILEVRERYPDRTLAELYDPDKMPEDLLQALNLNDEAVERCYRARPFESDEDRLQVLFDLYAKMTAEEADKGSLFESSKTKKKRKRHA